MQRRSQASRFKQWASANADKVERFREASDSVGRVPAQGYGLQRQLRRHGVQACACQGTTPLQAARSRLLATHAGVTGGIYLKSKLQKAKSEAKSVANPAPPDPFPEEGTLSVMG